MSYDYVLMKLRRPVTDLSELGPDTVAAIGDAMTARRAIDAIVPGIKWLESGGSVETEQGWMEFCVAEGESKVEAVTVRTSHRPDHAWESGVINKLCSSHEWVALDPQEGSFVGAVQQGVAADGASPRR